DDLITAVYVQPTARPAPSPPPIAVTHQPLDCDDEDCQDGGSGAGPPSAFSPTPSSTAEDDDEDEDRGTSSTPRPAVPSPPTSTPTSPPVVSSTRHEWSIVRTFTVTRAPWQPRTTQGAPAVISVPIPELTVPSQERQRPTPKAKSSADSTALPTFSGVCLQSRVERSFLIPFNCPHSSQRHLDDVVAEGPDVPLMLRSRQRTSDVTCFGCRDPPDARIRNLRVRV
ncbi:unnamed protein product, partial [Ixodes persulcatus]